MALPWLLDARQLHLQRGVVPCNNATTMLVVIESKQVERWDDHLR
jgi:hypothetical protein